MQSVISIYTSTLTFVGHERIYRPIIKKAWIMVHFTSLNTVICKTEDMALLWIATPIFFFPFPFRNSYTLEINKLSKTLICRSLKHHSLEMLMFSIPFSMLLLKLNQNIWLANWSDAIGNVFPESDSFPPQFTVPLTRAAFPKNGENRHVAK